MPEFLPSYKRTFSDWAKSDLQLQQAFNQPPSVQVDQDAMQCEEGPIEGLQRALERQRALNPRSVQVDQDSMERDEEVQQQRVLNRPPSVNMQWSVEEPSLQQQQVLNRPPYDHMQWEPASKPKRGRDETTTDFGSNKKRKSSVQQQQVLNPPSSVHTQWEPERKLKRRRDETTDFGSNKKRKRSAD